LFRPKGRNSIIDSLIPRQPNAGQNLVENALELSNLNYAITDLNNFEEVKEIECLHFLNPPRNFLGKNEISLRRS
jgi:hypothetical protein